MCSDDRCSNALVVLLSESAVCCGVGLSGGSLGILCKFELLAQALGLQLRPPKSGGAVRRLLP